MFRLKKCVLHACVSHSSGLPTLKCLSVHYAILPLEEYVHGPPTCIVQVCPFFACTHKSSIDRQIDRQNLQSCDWDLSKEVNLLTVPNLKSIKSSQSESQVTAILVQSASNSSGTYKSRTLGHVRTYDIEWTDF